MRRLPFPARLGITILLPAVFVLLADKILLPGADRNAIEAMRAQTGFSLGTLSVFTLGLTPVVTAYFLVELIAALVPRFARLRHGNPSGRAKLERAARGVALFIAAIQGLMLAQSLQRITSTGSLLYSGDIGSFSTPVVVFSLVGGVCALVVAADFISRQGIANGIVLFTILAAARDAWALIVPRIAEARLAGRLYATHVGAFVLGLLVLVLATWLVRRAPEIGAFEEKEEGREVPYREARALVTTRYAVPIPASSLAPLSLSLSLLALPTTLLAIAPKFRRALEGWLDMEPWLFTLLTLVLTLLLGLGLARLLHRPSEMADVARRLGTTASGGDEHAVAARRALSAAIPGTLLFLVVVALGYAAISNTPLGAPGIYVVPLVVAVVIDARGAFRDRSLVSVWQERRLAALPAIRAVLAAEGIASRTHGTAVLSLVQVFAPYAAADVLVHEEDAPRATAVLGHLFLGLPAPERASADAHAPRETRGKGRDPKLALLVCAGVAMAAFALTLVKNLPPPSGMPPAKLEFVKVDDDVEPFARVDEATVPPGIELRIENAPIGAGTSVRRTYARAAFTEGESFDHAVHRLETWLQAVPLPQGARWGFEGTEDWNEDTGKPQVDGVRTYVLVGEPSITRADVLDAAASVDAHNEEFYVALTFSPEGAERFAEVTREWTYRRFAIMIDGRINSAPVIKSEIRGGRASITMGRGDPDLQREQAQKLAARLLGR